MFGSKKRKEEEAAARAAFAAESAGALAGFQKRIADIRAGTDQGKRLLALDKLSADLSQRINLEEKKTSRKTPGAVVGVPSALLGMGGVITGCVTGMALIAFPALILMGCGVGAGIAMDERATNKAKRLGLYSALFVQELKTLDAIAKEEKKLILLGPYEGLSSSVVFDKIVKKYPSVKEAFIEHAVIKGIIEKKPSVEVVPPPPKHGAQDFTL
jgi:hypothetical protein